MLYAIVSDIHGNYNAWAAVLEDARAIGVGRIVCLGDVVGYGPEPGRCVQSIRDVAHACVLGNHDAVITKKLDSIAFNDHARKLIEWTELQLNPEEIDYLNQLDYEFSEDCFRCVHGDCDAPHEFNYIVDCDDAKLTWERTSEQIIFCGHSHIPAVFVATNNYEEMCALPPQDFSLEDSNRYIVNVGSVGSPRDDDLRASYVLFDSETKSVFFRRVCYNFDEFRARVKFVGLNENDVPLLCYVLEDEIAEDVALEKEIRKTEIVITNEASDLAKTVNLHNIDLSEILKLSSTINGVGKLSPEAFAAAKKQIAIKKFVSPERHRHQNKIEPQKPVLHNTTVLKHKPGVRANKASFVNASSNANAAPYDTSKECAETKYLRKINAAEHAPAKALIFVLVVALLIFLILGVAFFGGAHDKDNVVRYPDKELEIIETSHKQGTDNLLDDIWMNSGNPDSLAPYRVTTANNVNIYFDNIDRKFGAELIFQNTLSDVVPICFESPFVEVDPKGKYLILAKVYFDDVSFADDVHLQIVHANNSNLHTALPNEELIYFHKREIAKSLYKNGNIPRCFEYRPSNAGWLLAKRTVERRELKQYMRVIISGNFKGRMSIGGISIQRID